MSAANLEEVIAEVLVAHEIANSSRERYCTCGAFLGDWADERTFKTHQARAVVAALEAAGSVEWGLFRKSDPLDASPLQAWKFPSGEAAMRWAHRNYTPSLIATIEPRSRVTGPWTRAE